MPRYPNPRGRLVPAYRSALIEHVEVQGAPGRLGQPGKPGKVRADSALAHSRPPPGGGCPGPVRTTAPGKARANSISAHVRPLSGAASATRSAPAALL